MDKKEERIEEIDKRIESLTNHMTMWRKAGGMGGKMAMQAYQEIKNLEMEKDDLVNNTNNLAIRNKEKEINQLKKLKEEAMFLKS